MAAVPILAGVGIMMVCCSSSSVASLMMGGEEKKVPDGNDAAGEAQAKADAVAADPNSTPEEVTAAQAKADAVAVDPNSTPEEVTATQAEAAPTPTPTPTPTPSTVRGKAIGGYYNTFAECWADAPRDWGENGKFNCCEKLGKTPYPERSDGAGYLFCYKHT
jgi:hypothetical protein